MASRAEEAVMAEVHLADDFYLSKERGDAKKILAELQCQKGGSVRSGDLWRPPDRTAYARDC